MTRNQTSRRPRKAPANRRRKAPRIKSSPAARRLRRPVQPTRRSPASNNISRRPNNTNPLVSKCSFSALERITTVPVPTSVTSGTLLYTLLANPLSAPRLRAIASQFDSWYGEMSMEVETTGNSFSKDYVILRHLPNGDPSLIPTTADSLLALSETSDRPGESTRLQLDSNKVARVTAPWKTSYNPRKPIVDADLNDCNNGLFIIVADGSPGTDPVNLTIRIRYTIHFYGALVSPILPDRSTKISSAAPTASSIFGAAPTISGVGGATASGNTVVFTNPGRYLCTLCYTLTNPATGGFVMPSASGTAVAVVLSQPNSLSNTAVYQVTTKLPNQFLILSATNAGTTAAFYVASFS